MTVSLLEEDLIFSPSYKFPTFFFKNSEILKMTLQRYVYLPNFLSGCMVWNLRMAAAAVLYSLYTSLLFYFSCLDGMTYNSPISKWVFFFNHNLKNGDNKKTSYLKWTCYWYNMVRIITCYCSLLLFILQGSMNYFCYSVSFKIGRLVNFV